MKINLYKKYGQTLMEVMIVTFIIGILATAAVAVIKSQSHKSIKVWDYAAVTNLTTIIDEINLEYKEKSLLTEMPDFEDNTEFLRSEWGGKSTLLTSNPNQNINVLKSQINVVTDNSNAEDYGTSNLSDSVAIKNSNDYSVSNGKRITLANSQIYYFGRSLFFVTEKIEDATYTGTNGMISYPVLTPLDQGARGYKVIPIFIDVDGASRGDSSYATSSSGGDIAPYLLFVDYITPMKSNNSNKDRTSFILPYGDYADSDRIQIMVTRSDSGNVEGTSKSKIYNYRDAICETRRVPNYSNFKLPTEIYNSFCGDSYTSELPAEDGFVYWLTFVSPIKNLKNISGLNVNR